MLQTCILLLIVCSLSAARDRCPDGIKGAWPKQDSLLGFWPLDAESQLDDIANKNCLESDRPKLMTSMNGPFDQPDSSYSVVSDNSFIGYKYSVGLPSAFTISFYFFTEAKSSGGIFMFWPHEQSEPRFAISYRQLWAGLSYLELWGGRDGKLIGSFPILKPKSWNFVAITYDKSDNSVKIYNKDGVLVGSAEADIPTDPSARINVGYAYWGAEHLYMRSRDAISCLMLYKTALEWWQIRELPYHCQTKGQGSTGAMPTTTVELPSTKTSWPRPESLVGFWPLNSRYNFYDVSANGFHGASSQVSDQQLTTGPFGDLNTAVSPQSPNEKLFQVVTPKLSIADTSFTVSVFLRRGGDSAGGIFEFLDKNDSPNALQVRYSNPTTIEIAANGVIVGSIQMVRQKSAWTFMALVYDAGKGTLAVYGKHGLVLPPASKPQLKASMPFNNNGIRLGYASRFKQGLQPSDSLSCLMVYSAALTASEIRQTYDSCRITHNSAPCGVPKVSQLEMPSSTSNTVMPPAGQFPFVASIRSATNKCSATIIDEFWLLTSASCFSASANAASYKVYVGQHNLAVVDVRTREHEISKIFTSGTSQRDLALVQVAEPIDFRNEYVNDACLFVEEHAPELQLEGTQFMYGWGQNGRRPFVKQTLPRYVPGKMLSESMCSKAWADDGSYTTTENDLCFMASSIDKDVPCTGDEGSPLLVPVNGNPETGARDRLVQVGVYYMRDANCSILKPGLFANIAQSSKWISETIACAVPGVAYPASCPQN